MAARGRRVPDGSAAGKGGDLHGRRLLLLLIVESLSFCGRWADPFGALGKGGSEVRRSPQQLLPWFIQVPLWVAIAKMIDDTLALQVVFASSILLTFLCLLLLLSIYKYIRQYQQDRNDTFEEQSCFDQIDYLIHLICQQEKVLELSREELERDNKKEGPELGGAVEDAVVRKEETLQRYNKLSKKFYTELDILHEMMSRNDLEFKIQKKGIK